MLHMLALLSCLCLAAQAPHAARGPNGEDWILQDRQTKKLVVAGIIEGFNVAAFLEAHYLSPTDDKAIKELTDRIQATHRRYIAGGKLDTLTDRIDAFYSEPRNRGITLASGAVIALMQIAGECGFRKF